jgi:hypothetical protein
VAAQSDLTTPPVVGVAIKTYVISVPSKTQQGNFLSFNSRWEHELRGALPTNCAPE